MMIRTDLRKKRRWRFIIRSLRKTSRIKLILALASKIFIRTAICPDRDRIAKRMRIIRIVAIKIRKQPNACRRYRTDRTNKTYMTDRMDRANKTNKTYTTYTSYSTYKTY